ncbi:LCP family protein [Streptomyces tsukubensis]|uniref:LytR family transcriptional regulator n=1 Tax=Streptomyces tsukubensis TaxID=83656 RepID=A0A1V4A1X7_9ACTN|nr:LCP family protein [Streptomyces tsukubensis]OON72972.1 LytR family transcriptional regulator [Streptomyces tsukubensis]QFR93955.1 LytR family transcriptional regulator [Streptomyces tsukubensis]
MDAQGRGRADDIDPADQWVLNPDTGDYELRLDASAGQSPVPPPRRAMSRDAPPVTRAPRDATSMGQGSSPVRGGRAANRKSAAPERSVPTQRGHRAAADESGSGGRRRTKKKKKSTKKKVLLWTGGSLAFFLVAGSATAYVVYQRFNGNIGTTDVGSAGSQGVRKGEAFNVLLIGTDKRTGSGNEGYGDKGSVGHADTNILLHVSKDRTNATALSIPRDLITDVPDCPTKMPDGTTTTVPGTSDVRFNTSLGQSDRDPGCTMRTVKELTGLKVDHFMMADFNAIKTLTTAVDGVEVCVAKDVDDPDSHLKLSAGKHNLQGEQALAFVRTRHSFGNQGDLDRIKVQQQFLASLMRKMKSEDTLTSPAKMWKLANAATKALHVDSGIGSIKKLTDLGLELKDVDPKNITFTTLPVIDNPAEKVKATVVLNEAQANPLFAMMRSDTSLTEVAAEKKAKEKKAEAKENAKLKGAKADPADVRVDVYNGSSKVGAAQETLTWLQNTEGVLKSSQRGNAPASEKTNLTYGPNQADQARALADMMGLPASALQPGTEDAGAMVPMKLTLGGDFEGPGTPISAPTKVPDGVQKVEADKSVCAK